MIIPICTLEPRLDALCVTTEQMYGNCTDVRKLVCVASAYACRTKTQLKMIYNNSAMRVYAHYTTQYLSKLKTTTVSGINWGYFVSGSFYCHR